ncbi:MAG: hypothetical protein HDS67_00085 [Bacteroidales bacterium]|nr:hypothetical protein [Bacteroidales bacterium]
MNKGDKVRNPQTKTEGILEGVKDGKMAVRVGNKLRYWTKAEIVYKEQETPTIMPSITLPAILQQQTPEVEKEEMSDDTYFRYVFLPFLTFEVAIEYIQTVLNQASQLRLSDTKKAARTIREAISEYHSIQKKCLGMRQVARNEERMETFHDTFEEELNIIYKSVYRRVLNKFFSQSVDMKMFYASVYMAMIVLQGCKKYSVIAYEHTKRYYDQSSFIWPRQFREMEKALPEFLMGKKLAVKMEEAKTYADLFVEMCKMIRFAVKDPKEIEKQKQEFLSV